MTIESKTTVKTYFETGDTPTQEQFDTFIESCLFLPTSGSSLSLGVVEVLSTASSTAHPIGAFGKAILGVAATASAVGLLSNDLITVATEQSFGAPKRVNGMTANDCTYSLTSAQNFRTSITSACTMSFSGAVSALDQSGLIRLVNTSGLAITFGAGIEAPSGAAAAISTAGTYEISYWVSTTAGTVTLSYNEVV